MSTPILDFFNRISNEYDDLISRSVPRYREMFWAMLYYLPPDFKPANVLELGCGTGNLTKILAERWPNATFSVVDISREMLDKTAEKLPNANLVPIQSDFEQLELSANQYDLVISSIAMHHIRDAAKEKLIHKLYQWLTPGGLFVLGDQVHGANERIYQADVTFYEAFAQENGASLEDVMQWRQHREEMDHYATLGDLSRWMADAGLKDIDVLWRYCFWAVLQAQKPKT